MENSVKETQISEYEMTCRCSIAVSVVRYDYKIVTSKSNGGDERKVTRHTGTMTHREVHGAPRKHLRKEKGGERECRNSSCWM